MFCVYAPEQRGRAGRDVRGFTGSASSPAKKWANPGVARDSIRLTATKRSNANFSSDDGCTSHLSITFQSRGDSDSPSGLQTPNGTLEAAFPSERGDSTPRASLGRNTAGEHTSRAFPRREACHIARASSGGEPEGQQRRRASRRPSNREHRLCLWGERDEMSGFQPHGAAGGSGGQVRVPPFHPLVDPRLVATVDGARPPSHPRARDPLQIRSIVFPLLLQPSRAASHLSPRPPLPLSSRRRVSKAAASRS